MIDPITIGTAVAGKAIDLYNDAQNRDAMLKNKQLDVGGQIVGGLINAYTDSKNRESTLYNTKLSVEANSKSEQANRESTLQSTKMQITGDAVQALIGAYGEWNKITEQEKTKRSAIEAFKATQLKQLDNQRAMLEKYMEHQFKERANNFSELFKRLDQAIDANNPALITQCFDGIITIVKQSPIEGVQQLLSDLNNPNIKEIVL